MAFCGNCGAQLNEGAKFCPKCGQIVEDISPVTQQQEDYSYQQYGEEEEEPMKIWQKILYLLVGPAGLLAGVVYLIRKNMSMAKSAFLWGGIGTVLWVALSVLGGSSVSEIEKTTKELMIEKSKEDGINLVIKDLTLVHKSGNEYTGIAECIVEGENVQYSLKVIADDRNVQAEWQLSGVGGDNSQAVDEDEVGYDEEDSGSSHSDDDNVAEVAYNEGYELGFQMGPIDDTDNWVKTNYTVRYGAPSTPQEKKMYNIYKQNFERGFREGVRAGSE